MLLGFGMPGGTEWLLIIVAFFLFAMMPLGIGVLLMKNRSLKRQLENLTRERNELLNKLLNKN